MRRGSEPTRPLQSPPMAACRACGAAVGREFRYCPQCGAPVADEVPLGDPGVPVRTEAVVRRSGLDRRRGGLVVGAVVLVLLALWGVSRGGGAGGRPADPAGPPPPATVRPGLGSAGDGAPASGSDDPPPESANGNRAADARGPVVDHPTGLVLLVGSIGSLASIDLDTGVITTHRTTGHPVLVTGGRLLVEQSGLELSSVPVGDPDSGGVRLPGGPLLAAAPGPVAGQAWLLTGEPPSWRLVDLTDGSVAAPPRPGVVPPYLASQAGPDVSGSRAGGVFARDGETYRRVFDGQLLGVSDGVVAAATCDQPNRCRLHWLDRATWAELSRPVPADLSLAEGDAGVWLSPDGRFLAYPADDGRLRLFDVARGAAVPVRPLPGSLATSPDGQFLALLDDGSLLVYETGTGRSFPVLLDAAAPPRQARTLLVPRP